MSIRIEGSCGMGTRGKRFERKSWSAFVGMVCGIDWVTPTRIRKLTSDPNGSRPIHDEV